MSMSGHLFQLSVNASDMCVSVYVYGAMPCMYIVQRTKCSDLKIYVMRLHWHRFTADELINYVNSLLNYYYMLTVWLRLYATTILHESCDMPEHRWCAIHEPIVRTLSRRRLSIAKHSSVAMVFIISSFYVLLSSEARRCQHIKMPFFLYILLSFLLYHVRVLYINTYFFASLLFFLFI